MSRSFYLIPKFTIKIFQVKGKAEKEIKEANQIKSKLESIIAETSANKFETEVCHEKNAAKELALWFLKE